jgi:hypothetical protein
VLAWALVIGSLHFATRRDARAAIVIGALVVSHWLLDAVVHVPDLPVLPGGPVVGAGLWNHRTASLLLELGLLAAGTAVYVRATASRDRIGRWGLAGFIAFLTAIQIGNTFGDPPPSVAAIAWIGQLQWLLVAWALWIDRHRAPRTPARMSEAAA